MKDRIKELRKKLKLTQQEFADKIGISRGNIAAYEVGKNAASDAVVALVCDRFNVNEEWLRTGHGEMFRQLSRNEELALLTKQLLDEPDGSFKCRLVSVMAHLDSDQWEMLAELADKLAGEQKEKGG